MEAVSVALLIGLIWKIGDWFKLVTNKDWNGAGTQVFMWVVGVVVLLIAAEANAFQQFSLPGMQDPLGSLNFWSMVLLGMAITSSGSVLFDFKKAFDNTDSAKTPQLMPGASTHPSP